jgi:2'-5' RNA ligase
LAGSVEGRERLRLFCALQLPDDALDAIVAWQALHVTAERPTRREQLHITLAFLGSRPAGELADIAAALQDVAGSARPPRLTVRSYRETRSVGMLAFDDEQGDAAGIAADLHRRLHALGIYEPEQRPWLPHLTVVRFRRPPKLRPPLPELGIIVPSDAAVYLSRLHPKGAQYEPLRIFALGG